MEALLVGVLWLVLLPLGLIVIFHVYRIFFKIIFSPLAIIKYIFGRRDIRCTWCLARNLKFLRGEVGDWIYTHETKSGNQDLRYKKNPMIAGYDSIYICNRCNAESSCRHVMTKKPSKKAKVWRGINSVEGLGPRKGADYG